MSEAIVQKLYNQLFLFEGKNKKAPYPIHKKLKSDTFGFNDIYEWITKAYSINSNAAILDAGCGVGYGSQYLANFYSCKVKGISISDEEVKTAKAFAKNASISNLVSFQQKSYDNLEPNSFDFILAIESVKHTLNIQKTLKSLKKALKPHGKLVIIDDLLINNNYPSLIDKYAKDWALKVILKKDDFFPDFTIKKDLTPYLNTKNYFKLNINILILTILKPILTIAPIMRGGLYLEQLFKKNMMKYCVIEYRKK
ncbi:methyltransferase domain-containing protein [uncultured Winogradskyella sp.]|uniref:SAM-dependent methyltransferase n=1 Tax=uncultured Winogradskyella sp. TaxID=395353 RepID=UPI00260C136A|nr:methyltransferase domain-containing protein [uncultured Winogradskyella sp.]